MKKIFPLLSVLCVCACTPHQPLQTVEYVDLDKYMGKWYEIAAFPQPYEKGCSCVTAEYSASGKDYVVVVNSCYKAEKNRHVSIKGKAFVDKDSGNAKLKVQFFWPFKGKYWIIDLADDYSYVAVGNPKRSALWILAREKKMNDDIYNALLERLMLKGFDITKLKKTEQSCGN